MQLKLLMFGTIVNITLVFKIAVYLFWSILGQANQKHFKCQKLGKLDVPSLALLQYVFYKGITYSQTVTAPLPCEASKF